MRLKILLIMLSFAASQAVNHIPQAILKGSYAQEIPGGSVTDYTAVVTVDGWKYSLECRSLHSQDYPLHNTTCQWPLPKKFDWEPKPEGDVIVKERVTVCKQSEQTVGCLQDEEGGVWKIHKM
jgi:hypothetical protein